MEEKVLSIDGGSLACVPYKSGVSIKRFRGIGDLITIPENIDGLPVIAIEKKAFLSCKTVKKIVLPDTVMEIGDWAFAHADKLKTVVIPNHELTRGKELFLGCKRLSEIILSGTEEEIQKDHEDGIGRMLAAAVTVMHDYFLFNPVDVRTDEWVKRWDDKLTDLLKLDDLDGFEELWTCGEEDYEGKDYDIKSFPVEKRKMKLRLVYFRLLHPYKISDSVKDELKEYLAAHTKGTKEPEAWEIIIKEHPEDIRYYEVFTDAGCVTDENFDELLADMETVGAQAKAYMIRFQEEHLTKKDAFSSFELDW